MSRSPYHVNLKIDLPILVVSTALWVVPWALTTREQAPPFCDPCNPNNVNAFDRLSIGLHDRGSKIASDAILAVIPVFLVLSWSDYGIRDWRSWGSDAIVIGESMVLAGALTEVVRRSVRRPRPFLYEAGVYPDDRDTAEATLSFYSGHTAALFALAVSTSYTFQLRHPRSKWRAVVWTALLAVASAEAVVRVTDGEHFPTDVLMGALVGTASGFAVTELHRRRIPVQLGASVSNGVGVSLTGRF